jgi:hypothetical protein
MEKELYCSGSKPIDKNNYGPVRTGGLWGTRQAPQQGRLVAVGTVAVPYQVQYCVNTSAVQYQVPGSQCPVSPVATPHFVQSAKNSNPEGGRGNTRRCRIVTERETSHFALPANCKADGIYIPYSTY